jgi:hypothetical protein
MIRLPFNENPIIRTWQPDAFLCGIITSENDKYLPYILNHYIYMLLSDNVEKIGTMQLITSLQYEDFMLSKDKHISHEGLTMPLLINDTDYIDLFSIVKEEAISDGKYVFGLFDYYHIPGKGGYGEIHYDHEYILYGYDDEKDEFLAAGYMDDGYYHAFKVSSKNFLASMKVGNPPFFVGANQISFLKFNNGIELTFNITAVKHEMTKHLNSQGVVTACNVFGVNALETFIKYTREHHHERRNTNQSSMFNLKERADIMKLRLLYMMENKYIPQDEIMIAQYNEVIEHFANALSLFMKHRQTDNEKLIDRICDNLTAGKDKEIRILEKILNFI